MRGQSTAERILDEHAKWYTRQTIQIVQSTQDIDSLTKLNARDVESRNQLYNKLMERLPSKKQNALVGGDASIGEEKYHEGYNLAVSEIYKIVENFFYKEEDDDE